MIDRPDGEPPAMSGPGPDWDTIESTDAFRQLVTRRRRFVVPVLVLALGWWVAFIMLVCYAQDFLNNSIYQGFTVAYALGLSQFIMVWIATWAYLRTSDRDLVPLERQVLDEAGGSAR
jgi:uncharacterized membrane protein (DUF485 family)